MQKDNELEQALKKCAVGFETGETVEEFAVQDGEFRLVKRKVTRRDIPPDIKAVKMLLDERPDDASLSDEELAAERGKLLADAAGVQLYSARHRHALRQTRAHTPQARRPRSHRFRKRYALCAHILSRALVGVRK